MWWRQRPQFLSQTPWLKPSLLNLTLFCCVTLEKPLHLLILGFPSNSQDVVKIKEKTLKKSNRWHTSTGKFPAICYLYGSSQEPQLAPSLLSYHPWSEFQKVSEPSRDSLQGSPHWGLSALKMPPCNGVFVDCSRVVGSEKLHLFFTSIWSRRSQGSLACG